MQSTLHNRLQAALAALVILLLLALTPARAQDSPARFDDGRDFSGPSLKTGQQLDRALLTDGKPLVMLAWAPDCPHCLTHMPYVAALFKKLDLEQVNFVTAVMADEADEALEYLEGKKLNWPVVYAPGGEFDDYFFDLGWPTTYVFAPGGEYAGYCDTPGPSYISETLDLLDEAQQ